MCEVVISGVSGKFPGAKNVQELSEKLYKKMYLVSESSERFKLGIENFPKSAGLIEGLEKCDVGSARTSMMILKNSDPQLRMLNEVVVEAILDSGYNFSELKGSNTGVYVGCTNYDAFDHWRSHNSTSGMSSITNSAYALSNRISYTLDLKGPSVTMDTACSSSFFALNAAFNDIKSGKCDSAIVAGSNMLLSPFGMEDAARGGVLTMDGISQPFDKNASGFIRSEAISVVFVQRIDIARRNYATVVNIRTSNDGFKKTGSAAPSKIEIEKLLKKTYEEAGVERNKINFVESHAASTPIGDKILVDTIDSFFCQNRTKPLIIGSVKSNTGHTESASGLVSLTKSILMFENEKIIPNINISEIRDDCQAFVDERIRVATNVDDFNEDFIGIDNFGILGANSHVIIKRNHKVKIDNGFPRDKLPRLVLWAGRTNEAVRKIFDNISNRPLDDEFLAVTQKIQSKTPSNFNTRGFAIFKSNEDRSTNCLIQKINNFEIKDKSPIVFVYSGVGSQWLGMGCDLMEFPMFSETIEKCHNVLQNKSIDLKNILTSKDPLIFSSCMNIFIGIVSIQIALTEMLKNIGIVPDFIIGHSVGELACAYADNCLSLEETILSAYARGKCILENCNRTGGMAAVAMEYEDLKNILPEGVEIACHNSKESFTISGDAAKVEDFVKEIKKSGHMAKLVESAGVAFHSSHIKSCEESLMKMLNEIIKTPVKRSSKWISTSAPDENAIYSDSEYFKNNLLHPVRFLEGMEKLPKKSMMIEIAPHSLLLSLLKQNSPESQLVGLTNRNSQNGVVGFLENIGKIYLCGKNFNIREIYPKIEFPVSRGTQMISPLIGWNHEKVHFVPYFDPFRRYDKRVIPISLYNPKYSFLEGHKIDGKIFFPGTGTLELVWETFALMHGMNHQKFSVCFDDLKLMRAIVLSKSHETELAINIHRGSGRFEVTENNEVTAYGYIRKIEDGCLSNMKIGKKQENEFTMQGDDFYKFLKLRGYSYSNDFKLVQNFQSNAKSIRMGQLEWNNNWTSFVDCLCQFTLFNNDTRDLKIPVNVRKISIDVKTHYEKIMKSDEVELINDKVIMNAKVNINRKSIESGGIQVFDIEAKPIIKRKPGANTVLETFKFIPFFPTPILSSDDALTLSSQIFVENLFTFRTKIAEFDCGLEPSIDKFYKELFDLQFASIEGYFVTQKSEIELKNIKTIEIDENLEDLNLIIVKEKLTKESFEKYLKKTNEKCMIIWRNSDMEIPNDITKSLKIFAKLTLENEVWILFVRLNAQKEQEEKIIESKNIYEIPSDLFDFSWVEDLKAKIQDVKIFHGRSKGENLSAVEAFYKSVVKDYNLVDTQCVFIEDDSAPEFDPHDPFYKNQLDLGNNLNVYKNGQWGNYRHLTLPLNTGKKSTEDHIFANFTKKGDLKSIQWLNGNLDLSPDDVFEVHYSALNFKDILILMNRVNQDSGNTIVENQYNCGMEFSGVDKTGKKVLGLVNSQSLANYVTQNTIRTFTANPDWTLEEASTIPVSYLTIYFAFFIHADIKSKESILIHSGTGSLGQAAIITALSHGMKVFATVGSPEKKEILMNLFPQIDPENIESSRDTSFEQMIMDRTDGEGVDYVLNSLIEEKLHASIRCLKKGGTFLEVGRFDMDNGNNFNMKNFLNEINFKTVYLSDRNLRNLSPAQQKYLQQKMQSDIDSGIIKPITRTVFPADEIYDAFKFFSSGKHIGKVVIKMRESEENKSTLPVVIQPRVNFDPKKSYIITGGLGGMGLEFLEFMILRDCKKLIISSKRGISNTYQEFKIKLWESYGVEVIVNKKADISTKSGCEELIKSAMELGPVGGIFNLAATLDNEYFYNMTPEKFGNVFPSKAHSAKYLDKVSRELCLDLDHFLVFSSIASGRGGITQSNYAMANAATEKIVEKRRSDGLAGKAVQWGPVGGIGMLENFDRDSFHGLELQPIASCIELMDLFLLSSETVCCSLQYSKKVSFKKDGDLTEILLSLLGINDSSTINDDVTISDLGVDSMSGTEIQHILAKDFGINLTLKKLRECKVKDIKNLTVK